MSDSTDNLSPDDWQDFCEILLRQHYGQKNFFPVPDADGGDHGIEFFTADGTIFQCYFPEPGIGMDVYKKRLQKKINDDLNKLQKNEIGIKKLLDTIVINQWVLLTPENKSKDLIPYCNKKKKEVVEKNISYIDKDNFSVKIETANSYPAAKLYAQGVHNSLIKIPLLEVSTESQNMWLNGHSQFLANIERKSMNVLGTSNEQFKEKVIKKYIQIDRFLEQLRNDHPDLHAKIEDSAMAQLDDVGTAALLGEAQGKAYFQNVVETNKKGFEKYSEFMSDGNTQILSFGYLAKWLAECYMDFK